MRKKHCGAHRCLDEATKGRRWWRAHQRKLDQNCGLPTASERLSGEPAGILDGRGFDWVSSHFFRKTVATRLDDAGLTAHQIADNLGHRRPLMPLDTYMGRNVACPKAVDELARRWHLLQGCCSGNRSRRS